MPTVIMSAVIVPSITAVIATERGYIILIQYTYYVLQTRKTTVSQLRV